jgi:hypothetical protein
MVRVAIRPLRFATAEAIARDMREADRREIYATRANEDAAALALDVVRYSRIGAVAAAEDGAPVSAIGAVEGWPGVWQVWMFATDRWPEVALATTRWARRVLKPALLAAGAHRAECRSLAANRATHRWLESLGAQAEARHAGYGKAAEDFITFAWRRDDVHFQRAETAEAAGPAADRAR